ncbi:hypothetical protein Fot_19181 [Forsythia ovata]|uniref:Uncharacterized protein n=1 Tax=Forsythia ovata TaxID=205694 RepID=A0ABD1VKB4_9LAMI
MIEVEEYKKNVDAYCSTTERLEAEALRSDVHRLVNDLAATCARAQEKDDKLQKEIEKKRDELNSFYVQQMSWEESLAKKDEELGVLNEKVESQDLALADMSAKIFEDGKQAGMMELLDLIKDELFDINFDFLYEEGETASLALPLETDNNEAVAEIASPEVVITSEAMIEPNNMIHPSQASTDPTSSEAVLEPTTRTLPTQTADTTIFENLQDL